MPSNWMGLFFVSVIVSAVAVAVGSVLILTKNDKEFIVAKLLKRKK